MKEFVDRETHDPELSLNRRKELGFAFSFAVKQTSVTSGVLIKWTKGFSVGEMVSHLMLLCFVL